MDCLKLPEVIFETHLYPSLAFKKAPGFPIVTLGNKTQFYQSHVQTKPVVVELSPSIVVNIQHQALTSYSASLTHQILDLEFVKNQPLLAGPGSPSHYVFVGHKNCTIEMLTLVRVHRFCSNMAHFKDMDTHISDPF